MNPFGKILKLNSVKNNFNSLSSILDVDKNVVETKNGRYRLTSKCSVCGKNKSKFIKKQEASGILSSLGLKTPLSNIPLLGDILF